MRPIVKICGLMRVEDVHICLRQGVDILGFVVDYPHPVPWNIEAGLAKTLIAAVSGQAKTCIVTGGTPEKVLSLALDIRPDYVQLHADESFSDVKYLAGLLGQYGIKIIKAIFPNTPDLEKAAWEYCTAGIYALLFDQRTPDNAACGGAADPSVYNRLQRIVSCPVILAGGITPENVADVIVMSSAPIIDLMTGVEGRPGVKDETKVATLIQALSEM